MADKPLELSRYCVPFTPFTKRLEDAAICLVSTAAVRHKDDKPFDLEGDTTFRTILSSTSGADLRFDDSHYDHGCVDQDINCVFPLDRLRELAEERRIAGLTEQHFSLGFSQALRELRETTLPALVREVERNRPDAVLLTGGWRLCHRTVVTVQRLIEMVGIPTVGITVEPAETAQARPPRALCPEGFVAGHSLGRPNDAALQKWIITDALALLTSRPAPGEVVAKSYRWRLRLVVTGEWLSPAERLAWRDRVHPGERPGGPDLTAAPPPSSGKAVPPTLWESLSSRSDEPAAGAWHEQ